jgi:hypothetical protein
MEIGIFLFFSSSGSRHSENLKRILGTLEAKEICNRKTRKNIRATGSRTSEKE